jgi:uncharacterized membrane protein
MVLCGVCYVVRLFVYKTQTDSYYQFCASQNTYNRCVLFHMMTDSNCDLCGALTGLCGFCGR